jgi:hypothetical protein
MVLDHNKWFKLLYSQTGVQRPPNEPESSGRCWQVVVVRKWSLAQVCLTVFVWEEVSFKNIFFFQFFSSTTESKKQKLSISLTFYARLFRAKVSFKAFLYLDLRFVLFWRKNIGAKAARNLLVKLKLRKRGKFAFLRHLLVQ